MALPNSPFSQMHYQSQKPMQTVKVIGAQTGKISHVRRVIGNNIHSGFSLPVGAGFLRTQVFARGSRTVAVHTFLHDKKIKSVSIPLFTGNRKAGSVLPIRIYPQTLQES